MDIAAALYRLTGHDLLGAPVARRFVRDIAGTATASATVDEVLYQHTTLDSVVILMSAEINLTPGAAQYPVIAQLLHRTIANSDRICVPYAWSNYLLTAAAGRSFAGPVHAIVFAGEELILRGNFNAGANANQTSGSACGWEIPRGNLQR